MNYKLAVFGVKDTTEIIIKHMLDNQMPLALVVTVEDNIAQKNKISGFKNPMDYAEKYKIEVFKAKSYNLQDPESIVFFNNNTFDIAISIGWQRIIPKNILDVFKFGVFGFHGSCAYLPYGRGRSPLNWSLALDDKRFILNMFKYDEEPDSNNVFSRRMWEINDFDTIRTMQYKNLLCSKEQIFELIDAYGKNEIIISKNSKDKNFWYNKRTEDDGRIDFNNKTRMIYNLVRATTHPFPGAFCYCNEKIVRVWKLFPFDNMLDFSKYAVGEIIDVFDKKPIVRTIDGSVILEKYDCAFDLKVANILY